MRKTDLPLEKVSKITSASTTTKLVSGRERLLFLCASLKKCQIQKTLEPDKSLYLFIYFYSFIYLFIYKLCQIWPVIPTELIAPLTGNLNLTYEQYLQDCSY